MLFFARTRAATAELAICVAARDDLLTERETLEREVVFLNELLEETRHGVVPCWRRPEAFVPSVVLTVMIENDLHLSLNGPGEPVPIHSADGEWEAALEQETRSALLAQLRYAASRSCYLRVEVRNGTNDFELYRRAVAVLRRLGLVVINA